MPTDTSITSEVKVPADLHQRVQEFLDANPTWHYDDFVASAISLLLLQLTDSPNRDVRIYLDRMFYRLWGKDA